MPKYWFLGLEIYIPSIDEIINAVVAPISNAVWLGVQSTTDTLSPLFNPILATLGTVVGDVLTGVDAFLKDPLNYVQTKLEAVGVDLSALPSTITGVQTTLGGLFDSGVQRLWGGIESLGPTVTSILGSSLEGVSSLILGSINAVGPAVETMFNGAFGLVGDTMLGLFREFGSLDVSAAAMSTQTIAAGMGAVLEAGPLMSSPMTPEDAFTNTSSWRKVQRDKWYELYLMALAIEGGSLGQVDGPTTMLFQEPQVRASLDLAASWYAAPYEIGIRPLLERYWLKSYQPLLPDYGDMIDVYVKEGHLPEKWVELPAEFTAHMTELGYSEFWTQRLWGKHWVLPAVDHIYEMYARTLGTRPDIGVSKELVRTMLKYHDYEPVWRDRFEAIIWRTWRIYDLRVGWEMNMYDDETLIKKTIDARYNPDEAPVIANIQKMFVLRSEIDRLLTEADQDFIEGWIDEATLRANYATTPYRPEIQEMRIQRAILRRDREVKRDIAAALKERAVKRDLSESEYTTALSELGMVEGQITVEAEKVKARWLKKVTEVA